MTHPAALIAPIAPFSTSLGTEVSILRGPGHIILSASIIVLSCVAYRCLRQRQTKAKMALFRSVVCESRKPEPQYIDGMASAARHRHRHRHRPARARSLHIHNTFCDNCGGAAAPHRAAARVRQRSQVSTPSQCPGLAVPEGRAGPARLCTLHSSRSRTRSSKHHHLATWLLVQYHSHS
ncbi:hypothetical protein LZ30DRAFT_179880 [Colletotrichum cereale]|nr:hypothetical protein LZ30DRAFT_179880 [Colletotrichum cereale]